MGLHLAVCLCPKMEMGKKGGWGSWKMSEKMLVSTWLGAGAAVETPAMAWHKMTVFLGDSNCTGRIV